MNTAAGHRTITHHRAIARMDDTLARTKTRFDRNMRRHLAARTSPAGRPASSKSRTDAPALATAPPTTTTPAGRFDEAADVSRRATPIPDICARLCPKDHFCEDACVLNGPSEPVSIGAIEEFLEEHALAHGTASLTAAAPNACARPFPRPRPPEPRASHMDALLFLTAASSPLQTPTRQGPARLRGKGGSCTGWQRASLVGRARPLKKD